MLISSSHGLVIRDSLPHLVSHAAHLAVPSPFGAVVQYIGHRIWGRHRLSFLSRTESADQGFIGL